MILRCFALSYYLYCLRLRCLVSFSFYSTINSIDTVLSYRIKRPSAKQTIILQTAFFIP
ncbi:Uncharacterised protein [Neisseria animalis]|nr:Uncharacterised protein [Neisseria animalis]